MNALAGMIMRRATAVASRVTAPAPRRVGTIGSFDGSVAVAHGIEAAMGAICKVVQVGGHSRRAAVVGFRDSHTMLMPLQGGFAPPAGASVEVVGIPGLIEVGTEFLGRVIDGHGTPVDGGARVRVDHLWDTNGRPPAAGRITEPFDSGIRAINGLMTLGRGQRVGIVGGSGVGKSLLLDMLLQSAKVDIVVAALVGERSREITDFVARTREHGTSERTVIVAVPASAPALARIHGAWRATGLAEYFRSTGRSVLLVFDSLTRVAHAAREVGIAIGEPVLARGYPPSALNLVSQLVERAGVDGGGRGAITAIYTILADGDDLTDPIVDSARAILDGHISLSRELAARGHFPAIDLANSVSRVMPHIVAQAHLDAARNFAADHALVERNRDLVLMGAYAPGRNMALDAALRREDAMSRFLTQRPGEQSPIAATVAAIAEVLGRA